VLAFVESLKGVPVSYTPSKLLDTQTKLEEGLIAEFKAAYAASKCAALYTPDGVKTAASGTVLDTVPKFHLVGYETGPGDIVITPSGTWSAIAVENSSGASFTFDSIQVAYQDGSALSIPYGTTTVDIFHMLAGLSSGFTLTVDIDARAIKTITLKNPVNDASNCLTAGGGGPGYPPPTDYSNCSTSLRVLGLDKGNGLNP
jgi:hypothetical protein